MRTSHVGSFPLSYSRENVERVLRDLAEVGIDVPPYPQLRSFVDIFMEPLESRGLVRRERGFYFSDAKSLEERPPAVKIEEAELSVELARRLGFSGLRGPVTGAFTLASRTYLSRDTSLGVRATALADPDLVSGFFREYAERAVRYLSGLGYSVVFLDEPALTLVVGRKAMYGWTEDSIVELLSRVARAAWGSEVGVHVCGRLSPKIVELLAMADGVKYLSFEFHATPANVELLRRDLLEQYDKVVSPGIVSTTSLRVESAEEAYRTLAAVYEKTGGRVDLVSADCGFGGLRGALGDEEKEYELALSKLRVVVEATKRLASRR